MRKSPLAVLAAASTLAFAAPAWTQAPQADVPAIGTTFVFSDGRVERVVAYEDNAIRWASRRGGEYVRAQNIALPILEWEVGGREGIRRVYGEESNFWPPQPGKRDRFRVVTEIEAGKSIERSIQLWTCHVGKAEEINTPAGAFSAMPVTCDRFSNATMGLIERRTWHWSPDVAHYVRREFQDLRDGARESIDLCTALPPRLANRLQIDEAAEKKC